MQACYDVTACTTGGRPDLGLFSNKDCQLIEVVGGGLADHKCLYRGVLDAVDVQCQRAHCCADHAITVLDEFDRLRVQREGGMLPVVVEEELDRGRVQLEGDCLEHIYVVAQDFVVLEVEVQAHDVVNLVVAEEVEDGGRGADVLDQD